MPKPLSCRAIANGEPVHDLWDTVLSIQVRANHEIAKREVTGDSHAKNFAGRGS